MSSIVIALGPGFTPYAQPVFERSIRIIQKNLIEFSQYQQDQDNFDQPDKNFLIVSLDLLSGLTQGLGSDCGRLYQENMSNSGDGGVLGMLGWCVNVSNSMLQMSNTAHILTVSRSTSSAIRLRSAWRLYNILLQSTETFCPKHTSGLDSTN
jgi:transportin-1